MKRSALWCIALSLAGASSLGAQGLTMQMSNGWAFTFTGNVNAFLMYTNGKVDSAVGPINGGLVSPEQVTRIRTGLLPGFANFEASGKEAGLDLKVHFGFAPQIQTDYQEHDNFGSGTQAGAQIDMREVYLTVGGSWGQILAGRELGLYQRENILTDATLGGTGASGGGLGAGGTTLGRIGFGYIYPNFNAQITYSTPAGKPAQFSIGLFDPSFVSTDQGEYRGTKLPRVEAEFTWTGNLGSGGSGGQMTSPNRIMFWLNGMVQQTDSVSITPDGGSNPSLTSTGAGGGIKLDANGWSIVGSGYYASGVGTTLMFDGISSFDALGDSRKTWGYIGQVQYTPPASKWTVGASWGESHVNQTSLDQDDFASLVKYNRAADVLMSYQWTKSLRYVLEYTWARAASYAGSENTSNQGSTGFMLFF